MRHKIAFILFYLLAGCVNYTNAQDRYVVIESQLNELVKLQPGLKEKIEISVNDVSVQDFLRGIADANNLNISVDQGINVKVSSNFKDVTVIDVLIFLCKKYELDVKFIGAIINLAPYIPPPIPIEEYVQKPILLNYNKLSDQLSFDLNNDSLSLVTKELTKQSGKNFVYLPELGSKLLNGFVQDLDFDVALQKMAFSNNISVSFSDDGVYQFEKKDMTDQDGLSKKSKVKNDKQQGKSGEISGFTFVLLSDSVNFSIVSNSASLPELVSYVAEQLGLNIFIYSEIKGPSTFRLDSVDFDHFLKYIFNGTEFTFKKDGNVYLIGKRSIEGLRRTELFTFKFRTVDKISETVPAELKKGIDVKVFPDLNSFVLSGSQPRIEELKTFLRVIDRVVPVIQIEVMIMDVQDTRTLSTGIQAGLGDKPATTQGKVYPSLDLTLNSSSINSVINKINGLGVLNLGSVTPNFYLSVKALEQQGLLKLRSTPKLATLNGHEAKLSIGRTEYYLETQNSIVGVQNPYPVQSQQYKSVNADLALTISPIVSGDDQITLDIKVKQSNFTERISQTAPPGTITRDFESLIRVKNDEMIILGGLDENSTNDSGEGVPLLSRIPVLKWLFSSRTRANKKGKLVIFIRPTVIY